MTVSSVSATSNTAASTNVAGSSPYAKLGTSDYLKLLTTQMQNQDPTQPVDNTQMIAQMAQFSSLSGITDINSTLKTMSSTLDSILASQQAAQATGTTTA